MIKLERPDKPSELTSKMEVELTQEFKDSGASVWSKGFIKTPLLDMSSNKCCFCETKVNEESKYMEVEHFHHKNIYEDEVVDWVNLLPSCKKCNGTKGQHDTKLEPIVNPCENDPRDHLKLWRYRFKGKDQIGKETIAAINLNDQIRLVQKRFEIGNAVQAKLEEFNDLTDDVINGTQTSTRRKNRIRNGIKELMEQGLPDKEYAATHATVLVSDPEFDELKNKLVDIGIWSSEHDSLHISLKNIALL